VLEAVGFRKVLLLVRRQTVPLTSSPSGRRERAPWYPSGGLHPHDLDVPRTPFQHHHIGGNFGRHLQSTGFLNSIWTHGHRTRGGDLTARPIRRVPRVHIPKILHFWKSNSIAYLKIYCLSKKYFLLNTGLVSHELKSLVVRNEVKDFINSFRLFFLTKKFSNKIPFKKKSNNLMKNWRKSMRGKRKGKNPSRYSCGWGEAPELRCWLMALEERWRSGLLQDGKLQWRQALAWGNFQD
jgi:hypothetical protein